MISFVFFLFYKANLLRVVLRTICYKGDENIRERSTYRPCRSVPRMKYHKKFNSLIEEIFSCFFFLVIFGDAICWYCVATNKKKYQNEKTRKFQRNVCEKNINKKKLISICSNVISFYIITVIDEDTRIFLMCSLAMTGWLDDGTLYTGYVSHHKIFKQYICENKTKKVVVVAPFLHIYDVLLLYFYILYQTFILGGARRL